jgi:hypothetical protein
VIIGQEDEVVRAAAEHAASVHGHENNEELRAQLRDFLEPADQYKREREPEGALPAAIEQRMPLQAVVAELSGRADTPDTDRRHLLRWCDRTARRGCADDPRSARRLCLRLQQQANQRASQGRKNRHAGSEIGHEVRA